MTIFTSLHELAKIDSYCFIVLRRLEAVGFINVLEPKALQKLDYLEVSDFTSVKSYVLISHLTMFGWKLIFDFFRVELFSFITKNLQIDFILLHYIIFMFKIKINFQQNIGSKKANKLMDFYKI